MSEVDGTSIDEHSWIIPLIETMPFDQLKSPNIFHQESIVADGPLKDIYGCDLTDTVLLDGDGTAPDLSPREVPRVTVAPVLI
ncbi:hypothetical protein C497_01430 [Halalkalicoccus jeotgali B3]|uniref:Uncharacterized protein n=1 Tax=Halalkalicoccus jeotgali (strain DSM 18796 / CECT 7217 / JCM 14584 / KCTC 4019 / B3) TaxID=795797 RepID=D8JB72_HALJB|nr:hypothetical protein HacjB3_15826 [Halalkalicoccus jeotgali B3]ELY41380.1 hypothetical protein C497_01430 [Halalkalicoccus jeotgali B3]